MILSGLVFLLILYSQAIAQTPEKVVDIPTRPGITQRMLVILPPDPKASVVLLPGGHGGLQIQDSGSMRWGENNFVVRTRKLYADKGLAVVLIDAPSDRQSPPFLGRFRQTPEHAADIKAVIEWLKETVKVPVWLIGTSRGTQSVGYVATVLTGQEGPDGIVLSSTILTEDKGRPVPAMPLENIKIPVLVVHHEHDGCKYCSFSNLPAMMDKFVNAPRSQLLPFTGGVSKGDPCEANAFHGFNGIEQNVVQQITDWILKQ
jgi:pimeloyl-ACP methyl ester carboxylesterase